jgi:AcrR family transcriptional regulator
MPQTSPTPRRKTSPERRHEIAAAVLDLIGRRGASALTAATIADTVGVTSGALFKHFKTTDAMLEAAVDMALELARDCFPDEELAALERLQGLLLERVATIRKNPGLAWLLLSEQAYLTIPAPAIQRLRGLVRESRAYLVNALEQAIREGALRPDVPMETMLVLFTGAVHRLASTGDVHKKTAKPKNTPSPAEVMDTLCHLLGAHSSKKYSPK